MKFIVSSGRLLKELQITNSVISTRIAMPILENFLFSLNKNELDVSASDLENAVKIKLEVTSEDVGAVCIPSKILIEYLKNIENQPLSISVSEQNDIEIVSDKGRYKLKGEDPAQFPKAPQYEGEEQITLSSKCLSDGIEKTLFSVSQDDMRVALTGILFEINASSLRLISTDAHRLVHYDMNNIKGLSSSIRAIVPKKASGIIKNFIADNEETKNLIVFTNNHLFVHHNNIELVSRLIDADFPDYQNVVPKHSPYTLNINRDELLGAVTRLNVFSNKSTNMVIFSIESNTVKVSAQDNDFAREGVEDINGEYNGEPLQIAFNGKLLTEMLRSINQEQIAIQLSAPQKPAIIHPLDDEGKPINSHLLLIMPLIV